MRLDLESIDKEWGYNDDGTRQLWHIHKRFGEWAVKFHKAGKGEGLVLEIGDYWIGWTTAHDEDWVEHIRRKGWGRQVEQDLIKGLFYFRQLVSALKTIGVLR
jgi:hypothetical protein